MSACISRHGEFSSHTPDDSHTCTLCHVLDEESLRAELTRLRAEIKQWRELVDADRIERLHAEIENLHVELARLTAEWDKATKRVAELENAANWDTTCLSCSTLLDKLYARDAQAERDKPVLDAAEALREAMSASPYLGAPSELVDLIAAVDARVADSPRETAEPVEPTRHVDPGGEDCPRCAEIGAEAVDRG